MKSFHNYQNQIFTDDFLVKYVKTTQAEKKYLEYSLSPEEIKMLLIKSPEFLNSIDLAIEYLIRSNELRISNAPITFDYLQKKIDKFQILAKNRISNKANQINENYSIKKLESVLINDQPAFFEESLIYSYSTLIMISRSSYDTKGSNNAKNLEMLNRLLNFFNAYSIQSNFSPINTKLLKPSDDENISFNSLFTGIPAGSPSIYRNGIVSNGHFVFVLHSDMYLTIFPISKENGGFLSPFMCKFVLPTPLEAVSLSLLSENLIITTSHQIFSYKCSQFFEGQDDDKCIEIQTKVQITNKDTLCVITDGVVNVSISQHKELLLATVKLIDSQKEVNQVFLHQKDEKDDEMGKIYPFDNSILQWPVETNGLVLSFYIRLDQSRLLCRQFSLIDGCHLKDEIIETTIIISSISYDSINQMHYVAIENNGQLIVHALSASDDCSVNPFIFGFSVPDFTDKSDLKTKIISLFYQNQKDDDDFKYEKDFIYSFSSILLASIFFKRDINTFIIEGVDNVLLLPIFILETAKTVNSDNDKEKDKEANNLMTNIKIITIQTLSILFAINVRHQYLTESSHDDQILQKIESRITDFLIEISTINESFSMKIIAYVLLSLFDLIDIVNNVKLQAILEGLLISCSTNLFNYIIHVLIENSEKFSTFPFTNSSNVFNKYIINNCQLNDVHPNVISFLIYHQRCVINQVHRSIEKEHFSAYSLIININYNDCKTDNEALNNFGEYTNFLVNQFSSSMIISSSFEDFQNSTIYFLFSNYLSMIVGLFNFNEIAQIVTPLLYITQNSIKEFFERKKISNQNKEAKNILIKIGLAFGAFTATLIKGGNYSEFDEKYKWLIRPNMNLISCPDLLYDLDNPATDLKTFLDSNVQQFLIPENGQPILQKIYKKWNFNMNKNLRSPFIELDQLFLAVELYHLQLFDEIKSLDNIDNLRPALQQMMRVRNSARSILRSNESTRKVPIINNGDNLNVEKKDEYYSPFDLIVIKCKMLLRMKSKFDDSNISIAPKLLADFVLSHDQPSALINYISNQQNRLQLTNVGFSLIEAAYSLKIDELFINVIDTTLSIVVDNFDGLSAIIQYDSSHKSEKHISNFLLRVLKDMSSPYLALVVYKLMKSESLSNEIIGKSIELVLSDSISNNKLFGLCYKRFGYISNILTSSDSFLFMNSQTGKKVPLISLPVDDFVNLSSKDWFIISDVLSVQKCDSSIYRKILKFFLNNDFHANQGILQFVSRCIFSFYERFDDSYSLEKVKGDFESLLKSLSMSLVNNDNLERASEIVTFFRHILIQCNKFTLILNDIFKSYENLLLNNKGLAKNEFDDMLCAVFAILGGFVDVIKPNYPVSFIMDRENIFQGVFVDQNSIVRYPIEKETKPINIDNIKVYPEPLIPFNWCMFPNFSFIISFIYYATEKMPSKLSLIYLSSLTFYLKEDSFYGSLTDDHVVYLIEKLSSYMNPFDTIKDTQKIISLLLSMKKVQPLKDCRFSVMSNNSLQCTTYLSPVLKLSKVNVVVEFNQNFNGYFGLIADCPLDRQFPYTIINAKTGIIYPGSVGVQSDKIETLKKKKIIFSVDAAQQMIILNEELKANQTKIQVPLTSNKSFKFKIIISVFKPCEVVSIKVRSPGSDQFNTLKQFSFDYKPSLSTIYSPSKMFNLIEFPQWTNSKSMKILKNCLLDEVSHCFQPLTNITFSDKPLFEILEFKCLILRFTQAKSISEDLFNSLIDHVYSRLITQTSTLIMMYLVNNGFGGFLYNFQPLFLIKLFSCLQIPLEPYEHEKIINIEFPFLFNESILNENSLVVYNQQFNNIEVDMKNCLQSISNVYQDKSIFINALKTYIEMMGNDPTVHTLRNTNLNILHYDLAYNGSNITINTPSKDVKAIIASTSDFNNFEINTVEQITSTRKAVIHFPFIFDTNGNERANIQININQLKNKKKTVTGLLIDDYSNHWVFGTSFELLLLLKEYYLISNDSSFLRRKLVEWILIDSPFINIFLPKILIQCSQESFMNPSNYQMDYLQSLLCLSSLVGSYNPKIDSNLAVFLFQEKRSLNSNIQAKIAPFFGEFYTKQTTNSSSNNSKSGSKVSITLPDLDIPNKIIHPMMTFMLCKSFISKRESLLGYPYFELLPIWLSLTQIYTNIKVKKNQSKKEKNEISVIKKPNGFFEILNPLKRKAYAYIKRSLKSQITVYFNSCIIISNTSTFDDPIIINRDNIFDPIDIKSDVLYLSMNYIDGIIEFDVEVIDENDINRRLIVNNYKKSLFEFDPLLIHDDFVKEIQMLVFQWTNDDTSDLLSIIPPFLFQQKVFQPLVEIVLTPDMKYNSFFPPRVVLIVAYIVHRINYLHFSKHDSIPLPLWKSVNNIISFDEAAKQFLDSIVRKNTKRIYISVNRFEAHRMAIERTGNQSMSIICQMSKLLAGSAALLRSTEALWHVDFFNEAAIDVGGPSRELFCEISNSIFEPTSGLFILSPNGRSKFGSRYRDVYVPFHVTCHRSRINEIDSFQRNMCYKSIGVFLGIVMRMGFYQNLPFAPIVWKMIACDKIVANDVLEIDQRLSDFFSNLKKAAQNNDESIFDEQYNSRSNRLLWTCEDWDGSRVKIHNSTNSSIVKREHVKIYITNCIKKRIETISESIAFIRKGFYENIGFSSHQFMSGKILSFLAQGSNIITTSQLKKIFVFPMDEDLRVGSIGYINFWEAVERMNNEQRSLLLKFITAFTRLPNPATFKDFIIKVFPLSESKVNYLPQASTCFNTLYLPVYTTPDIAFRMITTAIETCQTMDKS